MAAIVTFQQSIIITFEPLKKISKKLESAHIYGTWGQQVVIFNFNLNLNYVYPFKKGDIFPEVK